MEVKIKIKDPILRSYLPGLFERVGGGYAVTMDTFTGTVICSLVQTADYPVQEADDDTTVVFHLPQSRYTESLRNKCLFVTSEGTAKINAVLRKEFDINFISFCTESRIQGFKLKDIIAMFIVENQMEIFHGDIETMKKRYYRKELSTLRRFEEKLRKKAYAAAALARETMKKKSSN